MDEKNADFLKQHGFKQEGDNAEAKGNRLIGDFMRNMENVTGILPVLSEEAKDTALKAFFDTDDKIHPSIDAIWQAVDDTMEHIKKVNPQLADLIEQCDAEDTRGQRPVAYFITVLLTAKSFDGPQAPESHK